MRLGLCILLIAAIFCFGCATKATHNSYAYRSETPQNYLINLRSVTVTIDHVNEESIARQLRATVDMHLRAKQNYKFNEHEILNMNIIITQRSFMYDVEIYNSIYASIDVCDDNDKIYLRETEFISGKRTFVSAIEQEKIISRVLDRVLKTYAKQNRQATKFIKKMKKLAAKDTGDEVVEEASEIIPDERFEESSEDVEEDISEGILETE